MRIVLEPQSMPKPPTLEGYNKWKSDYIDCLSAIDGRLAEKLYLCADTITMCDIVVFNDLAQFLAVTDTALNHPDMDKHFAYGKDKQLKKINDAKHLKL